MRREQTQGHVNPDTTGSTTSEAPPERRAGPQTAFAHAAVGMAETSLEGLFLHVNEAFCAMTGYTRDELLGTDFRRVTHPGDLPEQLARIERMLSGAIPGFVMDKRCVTKGGEVVHVQSGFALERDAAGTPQRIILLVQQVSDRRRAEAALRESELRFRLAFDHAPIGMALVAPDGRILKVNKPLCELLGYQEREMLNLTYQVITHPEDLDADNDLVRRVLKGELERYTMEKRYFHKRGHIVWILLHVSIVRDERDEPLYFVAQIKDITDVKRAEIERERLLAEVTTARARLQELSGRLVHVQEKERHTIARELHDEVGQMLTGLKLMLETGARPGATVDLTQAQALAEQLLERVRDLSLRLRPPMLDDLGLVPTLLWHFEHYRAQTGIEVQFHHRGVVARLPAETEITAFRLIQEALTNVARHAGVRDVTVELWSEEHRLRLRVEDQGRGFDPAALAGPSIGLTGMRERAALAGGVLTMESRPHGGTRVGAELPLTGEGVAAR